MKKFFLTVFVLIVLAIIGFAGYVSYNYLKEKNSLQFTPITLSTDNATSTDGLLIASSTNEYATSTADTSSWKSYSSQELGYSLKYPSDLIMNRDEFSLILAFPKKLYFSWPLEDSVKITVTSSSTCTSHNPVTFFGIKPKQSSITIEDKKFVVNRLDDVAAGSRVNVISYEIKENGICYSLLYYSQGANGAGLYVDDPILIKKYDEQHSRESKLIMDIVYGILASFKFISIPEGMLEG